MKISIRQINENDWQDFRELRLKALRSDPKVFGSNYEREKNKSKLDWKEWVGEKHQAIFFLYDGEKLIGMTGVFIPQDTVEKSTAYLWGSWLEQGYRRKGLSELMYKARIDWAKGNPSIRRIVVSHRESNSASKFANQKHGFVESHRSQKDWVDGSTEDEVFYALTLKP